MKVKINELNNYKIQRDGITFSPRVKYIDDNLCEIINTAEEVYEEWKSGINKKPEKKPSLEERISELENVILTLL